MDQQITAAGAQVATFASYLPKGGSAQGSRLRFFRHRRKLHYAEMGDALTEVAKVLIERCIRSEWELVQFDFRLDRGDKLSSEEQYIRSSTESRLHTDLARLMRKPKLVAAAVQKAKPKRAAPKKAPDPVPTSKPVESESHAPSLADAVLAGRAPPP